MGTVCLLAAFGPELAPLVDKLPELAPRAPSARGGHAMTRVVGVGMPAAAAGTARALAAAPPDAAPRLALLIGTCGAYPGASLGIGDVIVSRRVHLVDASVVIGAAAFPPPMAAPIDGDGSLVEGLTQAGAHPVDVATTLAITVDDESAARLSRAARASVEHLEAYGAAVACAAAGVPFAAVLAVANTVGSRARDEWRAHHERASEACAGVIASWLERFAWARAPGACEAD